MHEPRRSVDKRSPQIPDHLSQLRHRKSNLHWQRSASQKLAHHSRFARDPHRQLLGGARMCLRGSNKLFSAENRRQLPGEYLQVSWQGAQLYAGRFRQVLRRLAQVRIVKRREKE